jgi:hypothetical protein
MARPRLSAAAYIERHSTEVGVILAELAESAGQAGRAWMLAVEAARRGDLDHAETAIIEADIALDIPVRLERQDSRRIFQRASPCSQMSYPIVAQPSSAHDRQLIVLTTVRSGVLEHTLRRWEQRGLIRAVRLPSEVRRCRVDDVATLRRQMFSGFPTRSWRSCRACPTCARSRTRRSVTRAHRSSSSPAKAPYRKWRRGAGPRRRFSRLSRKHPRPIRDPHCAARLLHAFVSRW